MNFNKLIIFISCFTLFYCAKPKENKTKSQESENLIFESDYTIAFGSCNHQNAKNELWQEVLKNNPDLWIWGGDNIYSDTEDMSKMADDYKKLLDQESYQSLVSATEILGTWDDHDYGANDAGKEYAKRDASQQLFLDFMGVSKSDLRRSRKGVYHSKLFTTEKGTIKVIILDTRFFRDPIERIEGVYQPNQEGTILGTEQWQWFESELLNSKADYNIIVSSIQILSSEHRWEKWANFPNEVDKFNHILKTSKAKGIIILSGDRHISEFSKKTITGIDYPIIDFTSSGLTHSSTHFNGEPNAFRIKEVISDKSFGVLKFNFQKNTVFMEMRGLENKLLQHHLETYR